MESAKLMSIASRLFFLVALFFLALAIIEKGLNLIGQSIPVLDVFPRQLLGWTTAPLLFVIAIVLRKIREELKPS